MKRQFQRTGQRYLGIGGAAPLQFPAKTAAAGCRRYCSACLCLLITVFASFAAAAPPVNGLSNAERRGGWTTLFDGKSTENWRNYQKDALSDGWVVQEGALVRAKRGAGDIVTKKQYEYFELSLEYRIAPGGNSGLMFHVAETSDRPWHTGPEVQIMDNEKGRDNQKSGWLYQLYRPVKPDWAKRFEQQMGYKTPEISDATRPAGQWNQIYLRISPTQCETAVNGVSYYYFRLGDEDWKKRVALAFDWSS